MGRSRYIPHSYFGQRIFSGEMPAAVCALMNRGHIARGTLREAHSAKSIRLGRSRYIPHSYFGRRIFSGKMRAAACALMNSYFRGVLGQVSPTSSEAQPGT